jgi:hypothetical protein
MRCEVALDLHRVVLPRQAEPLREPADVRVDDDPLRLAELGGDDVRRLARDARQAQSSSSVRGTCRRTPRSASSSSRGSPSSSAEEAGLVDVALELLRRTAR